MELSNTVTRRWLIPVAVAVLSLHTPTVIGQTRSQQTNKDRILAAAMKGLSSSDELERSDAIVTLLNLGETAIPSLIDLVRELARWYPPGTRVYPCPEESLAACEEFHRSQRRLRSDVIMLLGHLHAVEAVPLLIEIMELGESSALGTYHGPEVGALIEIGKDAVPQLLEALRQAEERRQTNVDSVPAANDSEEKIAMLLGNIGDARALPVLEELSLTLTRPIPKSIVETAIKEIKERETLKQSAVPKTIRKP